MVSSQKCPVLRSGSDRRGVGGSTMRGRTSQWKGRYSIDDDPSVGVRPFGLKIEFKVFILRNSVFLFLRQTSVSFSSFLIKSFKFNPTCSGDSFFNCLVDFHTLLVVDFFTFSSRFNSIKVFRYGPLKRDTEKAYIQFELDKQSKRLLEIASNFNPILNGRYNAKLWD